MFLKLRCLTLPLFAIPLVFAGVSILSAADKTARTGQWVECDALCRQGAEFIYYVFDCGDGSVAATARGEPDHKATLKHRFDRPGAYNVTWTAVSMSGHRFTGKKTSINIEGSEAAASALPPAKNLADPAGTADLQTAPQSNPFHTAWIAQIYDRPYRIDEVVLTPASGLPFPKFFAVEYSMDGGNTWQEIPSANYVHFPDPQGKRVRVLLHGLVADGLRVISHRPPRGENGHGLAIGGFDAIGGTELLFQCDAGHKYNAAINNIWLVFGSAKNEVHLAFDPWRPTDRPNSGGLMGIGSTIWTHWNSLKISWTETKHRAYFEHKLTSYPVDELGRIGVTTGQFHHLGHSRHYSAQAIFISGVTHYVLSHRDPAILQRKDMQTGLTLLDKVRKVMQYQLKEMQGETGVLVVTDPDNDGTVNGKSDNYWDGWRFGYKSTYENTLFYDSLLKMAMLEEFLGRGDEATRYRDLAAKTREKFNLTFWDDAKGRYVGAIDRLGNRHDYGFTFVNLEAIAYGVVPPDRAKRIIAWLDGQRIVKGDTSTGADIYRFKIGPRPNTLAAEAVLPSWWDDWAMEVGKDKQGEFGKQIQNGGMIFYVSYFDLMARLKTVGIGNAKKRFDAIVEEFGKDQLRRQPGNRYGIMHTLGIVREFPESGLVPLFYLHGILGLRPDARGLVIEPHLPDDWSMAEVTEYRYAGQTYHIRAARDAKETKIVEIKDGRIGLMVPADSAWILMPAKNGTQTLTRYQP